MLTSVQRRSRRWFSGKPLRRRDQVLSGEFGQAHFSTSPTYATHYFYNSRDGLVIEAILLEPKGLLVDHEEVLLPRPWESVDPVYQSVVARIHVRVWEDVSARVPISLYGGRVVFDLEGLRKVFLNSEDRPDLWNELFAGHPAVYDYADPDYRDFSGLVAAREFDRLELVVVPEFVPPNRVVAVYEVVDLKVSVVHPKSEDVPSFKVGDLVQ